ncbi:MAG: NifU family protein [Acidimicrobiales bacterium]|nr:NifU family protein [Acidimicrobiales bacterium]
MSESDHETPIGIQAETSIADPETCRFTVDRVIDPGGPFSFDRDHPTDSSPLIAQLFSFDDVAHIVVAGSTVSVTKVPSASWEDLRQPIGAQIRSQLQTGQPAIAKPSRMVRNDEQIRESIENLLEREVNPSIAAHGGVITIVDLSDGVLSIAMGGGCQGCASSTATLRDGFETMARRVAPELVRIVDTTNHSAGVTPFYPTRSTTQSVGSPLNRKSSNQISL